MYITIAASDETKLESNSSLANIYINQYEKKCYKQNYRIKDICVKQYQVLNFLNARIFLWEIEKIKPNNISLLLQHIEYFK